jgi:hypothetical protein
MPDVPRFCPFCRECYEEVDRCPEHDLALVPFDRLAPEGAGGPAEDEPLGLHDLRFGRGWLLLAVVLLLVGMGLPLVSSGHATASAYDLATDRAVNLWIVVAVAGALLSVWMRRRTLILLRGSRVAVAALALMAVASLAYTLVRVHRASALVDWAFRVEWGAYVLLAGAVAALVAAIRLGVIRQRRRL